MSGRVGNNEYRFKNIVPELRAAPWSKVQVSSWLWVIFIFVLLFLPFASVSFVVALALALLIPLAFILGLVEHHVPPLWLAFVVFIQTAGLADLVTDTTLLVKILIAYVNNSNDLTGSDGEEEEDSEELNILLARAIMTVIGALPMVLFFMFGISTVDKVVNDLTGTPDKSKSSSTYSIQGAGIILLAIVWKAVMVCLRLTILLRVVWDIVRTGRVRKDHLSTNELFETFLLIDLLVSGIPLGILTVLELFFYGEGFHGESMQVLELVKLIAVGVDAIAACYVIYFCIFGLGSYCHLDHDHDHDHHDHHGPYEEIGAENANETKLEDHNHETTALVINP